MYHDNTTINLEEESKKQKFLPPVTGFTHVYTPNDYRVNNDEALELHDSVC